MLGQTDPRLDLIHESKAAGLAAQVKFFQRSVSDADAGRI